MGLTSDAEEQIQLEKRFITFDVNAGKNGVELTFPLTINGKKDQETRPEQVLAVLLSKINKSFERQGKTTGHYVFSVPTYTTLPERVAYV